jgi:hypothetical protein
MSMNIDDKLKAVFTDDSGQIAKCVVNPDGSTVIGPVVVVGNSPDLHLNDMQAESIIPASTDPDQPSQVIVTL